MKSLKSLIAKNCNYIDCRYIPSFFNALESSCTQSAKAFLSEVGPVLQSTCQHLGYSQSKSKPSKLCCFKNGMACSIKALKYKTYSYQKPNFWYQLFWVSNLKKTLRASNTFFPFISRINKMDKLDYLRGPIISFFYFDIGELLQALGSWIQTGSFFCHSF